MEDDASGSGVEPSIYEQALSDQDWYEELSEAWESNPSSAESSELGSTRSTSLRGALFGKSNRRIDTIPEEAETSTIRIVLGETDVNGTPEWKKRLDESKKAKDLFSPCHLEDLFKEDTKQYGPFCTCGLMEGLRSRILSLSLQRPVR